jgi:hypothetical protein
MSGRSPTTLLVPDLPAWHSAPNYSSSVATALQDAYEYLRLYPNSLPAAFKAHSIALLRLQWRMCVEQQISLHYVLARSASGMGEGRRACEMLDQALEQSVLLQYRRTTAELFYLSGAIKRAFMRTREALSDLRASRSVIDDLKDTRVPTDPRLELKVMIAIAMAEYFQARYKDAQRSLDEARHLQSVIKSGAAWERHLVAWVGALVLRAIGQPEPALPILIRIAAEVDTMETPGSLARVHTALADVALDLAERAIARSEERAAEPLLKLGYRHALTGATTGEAAFDNGGKMLARLALVRHSQLTGSDLDRRGVIAAAMKFATNTDEQPVLAMARTAQAQEFLAQGDTVVARDQLRLVIATSASSEVPFMGQPAKAALQRIGGYEDW